MKDRIRKFLLGIMCVAVVSILLAPITVFAFLGKYEMFGQLFTGVTGLLVVLGCLALIPSLLFVVLKNFGLLPQVALDFEKDIFHPGDDFSPQLGCGTGRECIPGVDVGGIQEFRHK